MVIDKTIGLRVAPEDEGALDARQQGMDAYHFSHVLGFGHETPLDVPESAGSSHEAVSAIASSGEQVLVTALIDPETTEMAALRRALLTAGARTIIVTEAHVLTGEPKEVTVRNDVRSTSVVEQLRVEVLVRRDRADATRSAFADHTSAGPRPGFILEVRSVG